jgi:hypothetical protein
LYVAGEPAESLSEAVVALTYGAYEVAADSAEAEAEADGDCEAAPAADGCEDDDDDDPESGSEEHPAQVRAARQTNPAVGLRKLRIAYAPLSGSRRGLKTSHRRPRSTKPSGTLSGKRQDQAFLMAHSQGNQSFGHIKAA